MAATVSPPGKYPGVYVQTLIDAQPPTGGASTSVAAFIGRTPQGPVNTPVTCLSFGDFQRTFGGLSLTSAVSYQANGFFGNGGNQAEVVRIYRLPAVTITATLPKGTTAQGTYTLTLASLGSGPTVPMSTDFTKAGPKSEDEVYAALAMELSTEPALAGLVTITSQTAASGGLVFSLAYPSNVLGDGPVTWTISPAGTGSGTSLLTFNTSVTCTVTPGTTNPVILRFAPLGSGALFSVSVYPPGGNGHSWPAGATAALALYKAIKQSTQASLLVNVGTTAPTTTTLTLTYVGAVNLTLTVDGTTSPLVTGSTTSFQLTAANPGAWGNDIVASIDTAGINKAVAQNLGLKDTSSLFNLSVFNLSSGAAERYTAASLDPAAGANRLDRQLAASALVQMSPSLLGTAPPPAGAWGQGSGGVDSDLLQDTDYLGDPALKTGLYAFNQNPYGFNILCIPPDDTTDPNGGDVHSDIYQAASQICVDNNAMLILDPPTSWYKGFPGNIETISLSDLGNYTDAQARACAVYFPRLIISDPLQNGIPRVVGVSGFLAAVWASVDTASGIWKAPAGLDAPIGGILQLQVNLNDDQNGVLNPQGINALRFFTGAGSVVWGARTLRGADQLGDQYKYIPVQRVLDYIETSLLENTRWAVFQPNGEALWSKLQTQISVFMNSLFSQGAFAGTSASQAYFVKCDSTTTTPADTVAGIVNVQVGFAPLYPAEFVVITISQITASSG